jgi:undecaprenyl-phosphate 4-deoxy-4-formamido-L-arabinose transferase
VIRVSIVVPVYNGSATVTELVERLGEELRPTYDLEIVLVDDGSPDNSAEVLRGLAVRFDWVRPVFLSRNFSEHNAVMAGLNYATGDYVVIMDDDLQNPPTEVIKLVSKLQEGYEVVYSRYDEKKHSPFRNFGSWVNDRVATIMLDKPSDLYLCSFKALSRFVVDEVKKFDGPFPYIDGLVLRVTRNIAVVTVEHHDRAVGRSNYTFIKLLRLWVNMFTSFSILPLRLASLLGLAIAGLGLVAAAVFAIERLRDPSIPMGWASMVVSIMVLSGAQLFTLGMLGEYLGRMFLKIGGEPQFIVRETLNLQVRDHPGRGAVDDDARRVPQQASVGDRRSGFHRQ